MMFKILVLQALYRLSDDQAEFQIKDRLSFMRFLGLGLGDRVPDAKTIWLFREQLTQAQGDREAVRPLRPAPPQGRLSRDGRADRRRHDRRGAEAAQHRRREDGHQGGQGSGRLEGQAGEAAPEGPRRALDGEVLEGQAGRGRQTQAARHRHSRLRLQEPRLDRPAARLHPRLERHRRQPTTGAASQGARQRNTGSTVWADTAYRSKTERGLPGPERLRLRHPPAQAAGPADGEATSRANGRRSKIRAVVEHVFAQQKARMGLFVRTIGIARARTKIGIANLTYNLTRFVWHQGRTAPA